MSKATKSLYELLGVSRNATRQVIKEAFYAQAKKHHPDLLINKSNAEREKAEQHFKQVTQAYQILQDGKLLLVIF